MNLPIYYLVTKTMGCYALHGYKNMVTKINAEIWLQKDTERFGYKIVTIGYKIFTHALISHQFNSCV